MELKTVKRLRDLGTMDLMMVSAHITEAMEILNKFKTGQIAPGEMRKYGTQGADCLRACEARIDEIRDEMERLLGKAGSREDEAR